MNHFEAVKRNMSSMLKYSNIEFKEYKKTGNIIYLQQAGENLFNALENYIQYINKMRAESFYDIHRMVKEKSLKKLLYETRNLHRFFYNAEFEMSRDYAEDEYIRLSTLLNQRIKRLR